MESMKQLQRILSLSSKCRDLNAGMKFSVWTSMRPYEVGTDHKRFYKLGGNRLTLSTPPMLREGEQRVYRLVWERAQ